MTTHEDKIQDSKSQMVENDFSPQQGLDRYSSQFVDNRPEAVVQQKAGEMAMSSPQIQRMAGFQQMADKHAVVQRHPIQSKASPELSPRENNTGMPDNLKSGIETLSGIDVSDVRVHYNSAKPAQMNAHAYAQGTDIHVASGQEKHLAHEAWHTVQQKQGRVQSTTSVNGTAVNDNQGLEKEADVMGTKALQMKDRSEKNKGVLVVDPIAPQEPISQRESIKVPTGNNVTQCYSKKAFEILGAKTQGALSESGVFFMENSPIQQGGIWGLKAPNNCTKVKEAKFNGKTYGLYKPGTKFLDDCLHSAEEIVNGKILAYGKGTYSREVETKYVFGQSDKRNIEIAEKAADISIGSVNAAANAGVGSAFVIVDTEWLTKPAKRSPYHAGGVIAEDGNDKVTMEVFASGGSTVKRETDARLSMYTVGDAGESFHGYWTNKYFKTYKAITIVIKAK